jgi:hypothetical protein
MKLSLNRPETIEDARLEMPVHEEVGVEANSPVTAADSDATLAEASSVEPVVHAKYSSNSNNGQVQGGLDVSTFFTQFSTMFFKSPDVTKTHTWREFDAAMRA